MKRILLSLSLLAGLSMNVFAQSNQPNPQDPERSSAFHEAKAACRQSVPKNAEGKPNHEEMKKCLHQKGFSHGMGHRPNQENPTERNPLNDK